MIVDKLHSASFTLSELVGDHLVTRVFYGYTLKEAKKIFLDEIKKKESNQ